MAAIPRGFQNVDVEAVHEPFADYLRALSELLAEQKAATLAMLYPAPGSRLLDVGCGVGADAANLARSVAPNGLVAGIDLSRELIREARLNHAHTPFLEFLVGDAHELPWDDDTFDAARTERTLQHVAEPSAVLAEMLRVIKPSGRVVVSEPDWGTTCLDCARPTDSSRLTEALCDQIRHPHIGRQLVRRLAAIGAQVVLAVPTTLVMRSFSLADCVLSLRDVATPALLDELQERDQAGSFFASIAGFTAVAIK